MFYKHYLALCSLLLGTSGVSGEAQFLCPAALSNVRDSSQFPCGKGTVAQSSRLEVESGPLTISWQDAAPLPGSSYRVSLRNWADENVYCILQDRIPSALCSNTVNNTENCTTPDEYYITLNIPNITCTDCYLQVTTISPNGSDCLVSFDGKRSECPTFYTCANINIRSDSGTSFRQCERDFFDKKKTWPFKTESDRQNSSVDFGAFPDLFPYSDGSFSYTPFPGNRGSLTYQVDLWLTSNIILYGTSIGWKSPNGAWTSYRALPPNKSRLGSYDGGFGLYSKPQQTFVNGDWHIAVRHGEEEGAPPNTTYVPLIKSAEIYSDMTGNYTTEGWLTGPDFDRPGSSLSEVITPAGYCSPGFTTMSTESVTSVPVPVPTKPHPEEASKKPQKPRERARVEKTRFTYMKSGSDPVISTRTATACLSLMMLLISVIL